ncbi:hypothetical protein AVEN_111790-1 [Araneus ventricosus]|uniref:Tesmin/TSO1-like CXC domain-containing protein n=1 Tax=Araneus ventricosus TaxID=182803 RepID=A0A4Y2HP95_ARAVE|nr:hypothetical protein AVEN_111790-1 [Araneus ventricosus]
MAKKKKTDKYIANVSSAKKARYSFINNIRKARAAESKNPPVNQAGNSDLLESAADVNNLHKSIIKEFSVIRKSDGLITGTNEVLRLLEKEKLIAVFMFKDKASNIIKDSLYKLCKQAGVSFFWLEDKDRHRLGPEFPKSITYGIKKEPFSSLENLRSLLLELSVKRNKKDKDNINVDGDNKAVSFTDISFNEMKLPSTEETTNQEVWDAYTFYHTHEGHVSKKSNTIETGFLSLNKFSTDEKETDFLDYDSVACSGVLSINYVRPILGWAAAKTKFNFTRLPPTTDAAQLHAMRSYHQVQTWLANEKDPLKWGWMHTPSGLFPKKSEKDPAPESLLQCISCTCKKGCTNACGCRKAGLRCSLLCKHCIGQSCENPMPVILDNESEDGDAPTPIDMVDEQLECEDIEL